MILIVSTVHLTAQGYFNQKFVAPLDIPPIIEGEEIDLHVNESTHAFFLNHETETYGINGNYMGPTILMRYGDSIKINVTNNMSSHTTMHWHGFHVPAKYDGGPRTIIDPGETWSPKFKILDQASTYWYHPHPHGLTTQQVSLGVLGLIIIKDEVEDALELPRDYGVDDIPIVVQSKSFRSISKQIDPLGAESHFIVNSTVYPYHEVPAQLVRLRLMNGSNLRVINLGFSDNRPFYQITSDGGLLPEPIESTRIKLATGERAEVLVDFSDLGETDMLQKVYLTNYVLELPEGTPGTLFTAAPSILDISNTEILEFRGVNETTSPVTSIPENLIEPYEVWGESEANVTRNFIMEVDMLELILSGFINGFSFDNQLFDHHVINHTAQLGDIEIWDVCNNTPFSHPFHIHDQQFYILDRNGEAPAINERGRKDVVLINKFERVRIITKFEGFADDHYTYMYHCHILSHEDEGMMGQFLVVDTSEVVTALNQTNLLEEVNLFPNPCRDFLHIKWLQLMAESEIPNNYQIFSMTGQLMDVGFIDLDGYLSTQILPRGEYILQLKSNRKVLGQKLFSKL